MFFKAPVNPCEVTKPILAHICWMAAIKGNATIEVHKVDNP